MPVLVLDFDGTMTDADQEGVPFVRGYLDDLCTLVGVASGDQTVQEIATTMAARIAAAPADFPFLWMGRAVAPAIVDPYLRMVPIAHAVFDHFGVFANPVDRGRLLGAVLYKYNYAKTKPCFRSDAGAFLTALVHSGHSAWIVTNSDTEAVAHKLTLLARDFPAVAVLTGRVHGLARKFDIDDSWQGVPAELMIPGLLRPVLLRRRRYYDILQTLLTAQGTGFADLVVIGDIFELDLSLPLAAGAHVGLVTSSHTPQYERDFVSSHPRGVLLDGLGGAMSWAFDS
jgi:hypothetical protein